MRTHPNASGVHIGPKHVESLRKVGRGVRWTGRQHEGGQAAPRHVFGQNMLGPLERMDNMWFSTGCLISSKTAKSKGIVIRKLRT